MALRIVRRGNTGLSNDHNLLLNREKPDQHPIESVTGLVGMLDERYVMPSAGIPKKDLAFPVAEIEDVTNAQNTLMGEIQRIDSDTASLDVRTTALEDVISNMDLEGNDEIPNIVNIAIVPDIHQEFISTEGQTQFVLSSVFQPGNNSLKVYKNGSLMRIGQDYIETSDSMITFLTGCDDGDFITCDSNGRTNINSPIHEEYEYAGESLFHLAYRFNKGDNSLSVYLDGVRLNINRDYIELSDYDVEITKPMQIGQVIVFRRETHMAAHVELIDGSEYSSSTWKERFIVQNDTTMTITLQNTFIPNSHTLQVFVGGLIMTEGVDFDYMEIDEHTVMFNYYLDTGDVVDIVCAAGLYQWRELFISIANQVNFQFSNRYTPGKDDILVYEDGLLLSVNDDYRELNNNTIQLVDSPTIGSKIMVFKRR